MEASETFTVVPESPEPTNGTGPGVRRCSQCDTPLPRVAHFCPICGLVVASEPVDAGHGASSARGRGGRVVRTVVAAGILGGASVGVLLLAGNASDDGAASVSSPAAGVARAASRTPAPSPTPTESPTAGPSPSPRATITPTPILPTPVVAGLPTLPVPTYSPTREIVDAVNRSAAAYSAAMSRLDESLLDSVFTGEALSYYAAKIHDLRASGGRSTPVLADIQLVAAQPGTSEAHVTTRERWKIRSSNGSCSVEGFEVAYTLVRQDALWMVTATAFQQDSLGPC